MNKPWLVQRAKFRSEDSGSIDNVLCFDYMGSAEFEFGALPKSLKRLTSAADKLSVHQLNYCVSGVTQKPLHIISIGEISDEYLEYILLMSKGELQLKEGSYLELIVSGVDFHGDKLNEDSWCNVDVWWDIDNDIMWAFGAEEIDRVLKALIATRYKKKAEKEEGWY